MSLNWSRIKSLGHKGEAKASWLPSAGRLPYWTPTPHQSQVLEDVPTHFYVQDQSNQKTSRTIYLFTHPQHTGSPSDIRTFSTNFFFTWNVCACLRRLLIFHFHHTSGLPCMFKTDLWVSKHLILSSEGAWFYEIWLHCQTAVVPVPNGRLTKPAHQGASAILFTGQHYPLQEKPPDKGNMVKREAMTALSHSSLPLTQHKHQSRPTSAGSKRPLGCNLSQTRRRWHAS